jgi:NTE family protein
MTVQTLEKKPINIALQGGGSHGAFAWGVLDRLLEDERLGVEGIVGTSAGAMNAAVTAYGLASDGNHAARESLTRFWDAIAGLGYLSLVQPSWMDQLMSPGNMDYSPSWVMMDLALRILSPYQLNPANYHPLRDVLVDQVDFEKIRLSDRIKLFVCASNVRTNRLHVFDNSEISTDAVLASACLPFMFKAIEIDGEYYWDGGYMGNPPIFPLIYNCESADIVLIMNNPVVIDDVPQDARAILDRINTLSFNSSLMREMRAIKFVNHLVDTGYTDNGRLKKIRLHCIDAEDQMKNLGVSSKLNAQPDFIEWLFRLGRERGDNFLQKSFDKIGQESSTSIEERFI